MITKREEGMLLNTYPLNNRYRTVIQVITASQSMQKAGHNWGVKTLRENLLPVVDVDPALDQEKRELIKGLIAFDHANEEEMRLAIIRNLPTSRSA